MKHLLPVVNDSAKMMQLLKRLGEMQTWQNTDVNTNITKSQNHVPLYVIMIAFQQFVVTVPIMQHVLDCFT